MLRPSPAAASVRAGSPFLVLLLALVGALPARADLPGSATPEAVPGAIEALSAESLESKVRHLASDEMLGRATGSAEKERAARWIASSLEQAGAVPVSEEGWFQEVPLVGYRKVVGEDELVLRGPEGEIAHQPDVDFTWWPADLREEVTLENVPLVFVGHGITAPEVGWDDFEGVDVSGKVLVFLNDDPRVEEDGVELFGGPTRTYYGRWTYKFEQARDRGAVGAIVIHTEPSAGYGWQVIGDKGAREHFALDAEGAGYDLSLLAWVREDLAQQLAATVGADLESWFEMARRRDFRPVDLPVTVDARARVELERKDSLNVLGLLEGNDPELRDEIVVVTAHYDHLGQKHAEEEGADTVYNGAWDNAAGTAAMMAIAEGLAASEVAPRRSVLFFAVSAHEVGLLGSRWFAARPPVPLDRIVANVNVDMPQIFGTTRDMVAIGRHQSELGTILEEVAARFEVDGSALRLEDDPTPGAGRFYRSDQLHFARQGIPAIYVGPGDDYVRTPAADPVEYRSAHYHQLSDEVNEVWDFDALARDARVVMLTVLEVANRPEPPRWSADSEFANVR